MNEDRESMNVCPGCGRHCDLSMPNCERGETYVRTGRLPERNGHGEHRPLPPEVPGQFRHHGPASHEPREHGPHGEHGPRFEHGPHGEHGPRSEHGPRDEHGPRSEHGPRGEQGEPRFHGERGPEGRGPHGGHRPPHPHGKITDNARYQAEDVNGKLLTMLRVLGHAVHHMDGKGGQGRVLALLKEEGEMTQRALTEKLGIQPGSASEIIGKLEKAGFLLRTPSLTDRRTADVSLTAAGMTRAGEAEETNRTHREEMLAALTAEERETLLALMEKLYLSWGERPSEAKQR